MWKIEEGFELGGDGSGSGSGVGNEPRESMVVAVAGDPGLTGEKHKFEDVSKDS